MKKGIGSHQSTKMMNEEWLTPPDIIKALGVFDLDPCSPIDRPWNTANKHYTLIDDGLSQQWEGRVFCNPPYGYKSGKWLDRMAKHNNGIALIYARTETKLFFNYVWGKAISILFIEGRLYFHKVDGTKAKSNSGAPSMLVAYGYNNDKILKNAPINGYYVNLTNSFNKKL